MAFIRYHLQSSERDFFLIDRENMHQGNMTSNDQKKEHNEHSVLFLSILVVAMTSSIMER